MKSIAQEIAALKKMTAAQLAEKYREVFGKEPRILHKAHLERKIAWQIQAQRFGGLSEAAVRKLDELIGELDLPFNAAGKEATTAALRRLRSAGLPAVGTVLVRRWRGNDIYVSVLQDGYEWNNVVYRSLSAVAKAITGSHWNGPLFFNLKPRKRLNLGKKQNASK